MKTPLPAFASLLLTLGVQAQITTPVAKANFGIDAELRANYVGSFAQSSDDWFTNGAPGMGQQVIDSTGAAAIYAQYLTDPAFRKLPFYRTMRVPQYSVINNRLWIDAVYIRDYNGQSGGDETAFVMSNKNGQSPADWTGGVTSVLNKDDISDMMVHVRRAGPNKSDELWFMGGLSLQGTTGNRYFDFELYQTDIFYTRSTGKFTNFGPDAGHTAWGLDGGGNITKPGDVIFTAEYSSSSLTAVEARIWVDKALLSVTPASFKWGGSFDGANNGSQFGYANILPKTAGDYYSGLQSGNNTWAGPFGFIDGGNNVQTTYTARQFMEFSVSLSKLGLDPLTLLGGGACGLPFRRILVKTRSSTSFSSELKDFIGPFDFFRAPKVNALTDVPMYCGSNGVSSLKVTNALPASVYTWSTADGQFVDDSVGTNIRADRPGTYIVTQQLLDGCGSYAKDTVVITYDANCIPLARSVQSFKGTLVHNNARLQWQVTGESYLQNMLLQRCTDGRHFETIYSVGADTAVPNEFYQYTDAIAGLPAPVFYYRLAMVSSSGEVKYSPVVRLQPGGGEGAVTVSPNPADRNMLVSFMAEAGGNVQLAVHNAAGSLVYRSGQMVQKGPGEININGVGNWAPGVYLISITLNGRTSYAKGIVAAKLQAMK